ncbi:hypothetical protein OC861_004923 [Tilletia horrida]|nr:hypothetical protein OC845_000373 [Tilletia horrida]KAK0563195.1 hypothetical protein OC861_004923 [Tilletia horrida]
MQLLPVLLASLAIVLFVLPSNTYAARRGAPYGADSRWAHRLFKGKMDWYHHWQAGPINVPDGVEYVPTFWGPRYWDKWTERKHEMNRNLPSRLLAFNEPDVRSQANLSPHAAVKLYKQEICPWQNRGVKISTPQIVWDMDGWLDPFMSGIRDAGCEPDFVALHWYGSKHDIAGFKKYIQKAWNKYGKSIWITELGLTSASHPSTYEAESFLREALAWVDTQDYIKRVTWTGVFAVNNPPDGYLSNRMAMFNDNGSLRSMAMIMQYD